MSLDVSDGRKTRICPAGMCRYLYLAQTMGYFLDLTLVCDFVMTFSEP